MNKILSIMAALCMAGQITHGQDCSGKLVDANRAYYDGQFELAISHLQDCISKLEQARSKTEAYEVIIQSQLLLDQQSEAQKLCEELLRWDPFYSAPAGSLPEYQELVASYSIKNVVNLGFSAGFNQSAFSILQYHSYAGQTLEPSEYETQTGLNIGIWGSYNLIYDVFIRSGISLQQHGFTQQEVIFDYQSVSSTETYRYLSIPIQLEYQYSAWKLKPFVNAGTSYHILLSAVADINNSPIETDIPNAFAGVTRSVNDYDISNQRTSGNWNLLLGAGLRYSLGKFSLEASIYYENGESNLVASGERYQSPELYEQYSYVPDDFKLRQININLGLTYSFLSPKTRKI